MKHFFVYIINTKETEIIEGTAEDSINAGWTQFTQEQEEYYESHPNATVWEVQNLYEAPKPYTPIVSLEDFKEQKREALSQYSFDTLHKYVKDYQVFNAECSIRANGENTFYTLQQANEILDKYNLYGRICRKIYYTFINLCDRCNENHIVDNLYGNCIDLYDKIEEFDKDSLENEIDREIGYLEY